ncbi:Protein CBG07564 [Caenorhabditis briggsae]|uniref:Protein CBG07564 n=2 Tax=Caenorhabditis briggsae TaxID=6238 RepID=A8X4J7_CAEBR|nr:Protein CBG07564 [Caenorhabditis briggsae]ULT84655.1 hypothetical protein L3Y34_013363 [Caenorhabditis briggsae]CAP27557.1 Protein CBG07564 [Caenorhabditis briggsae]
MNIRFSFLCSFLLIGHTFAQDEVSQCNYVGLVKCFINILDEWAWTLYELKENVVTIRPDQCEHLKELDKCIKDDLPVAHSCSHNEIVQVSNTVSDLLTHRKDSGSFLRSYYLLTYACSSEGQEILSKHRDCLKSEKIGEMTLSAGTYLSEKFLEHSKEDVCDKVNEKLQQYISALGGLCSKHEAAQLMCQSLKNMFSGLHADRLENCELDCKIPENTDEESKEEVQLTSDAQDEENLEQQQSEQDALRPADSSSIAFSFFSIVFYVLLR